MQNLELKKIKVLIKTERAIEARECFERILPDETIEYLMIKGLLEQKFQNWGKAVNAFNKILDIEPENKEAKSHLRLVQNILNFWNPDQFNP